MHFCTVILLQFLKGLGDLQSALSQHKEAMDSYRQAISAYDDALKLAPEDVNALKQQGACPATSWRPSVRAVAA